MDTTIRTLQVLGLTSSTFLSGINIGASHLTVPILYTRPASISTPFFNEFYTRGAATLVPLGIFSASCSALVAYLLPSQRKLWAIAAVATFAQMPWTILVMMKTNNRLNAIAASKNEQEKASGEEIGFAEAVGVDEHCKRGSGHGWGIGRCSGCDRATDIEREAHTLPLTGVPAVVSRPRFGCLGVPEGAYCCLEGPTYA
jgi:Domain of unknown function (DUF1772)